MGDVTRNSFILLKFDFLQNISNRVLIIFKHIFILHVINAYAQHLSLRVNNDRVFTATWRSQWLKETKDKGKTCFSSNNDDETIDTMGALNRCVDGYFKPDKVRTRIYNDMYISFYANFDIIYCTRTYISR